MANNLRRAEEFDRGRDFVVVRDMRVNGKSYAPGEPFDPTEVTVRRLRQMYDARMIDITSVGQRQEPAAAVDTLDSLSDEDLTARLVDKGIVPRPSASRAWLLRKVREVSGG